MSNLTEENGVKEVDLCPPATGPSPEEAPKGGSNVGGVQQDWKKVLSSFLKR